MGLAQEFRFPSSLLDMDHCTSGGNAREIEPDLAIPEVALFWVSWCLVDVRFLFRPRSGENGVDPL